MIQVDLVDVDSEEKDDFVGEDSTPTELDFSRIRLQLFDRNRLTTDYFFRSAAKLNIYSLFNLTNLYLRINRIETIHPNYKASEKPAQLSKLAQELAYILIGACLFIILITVCVAWKKKQKKRKLLEEMLIEDGIETTYTGIEELTE